MVIINRGSARNERFVMNTAIWRDGAASTLMGETNVSQLDGQIDLAIPEQSVSIVGVRRLGNE